MTTVKTLKLDTLAHIRPEFHECHGLYDFAKDTIYLEIGLPVTGQAGKASVLQHERGHALLHKTNLTPAFPNGYTEMFCELYSLATSPEKSLTSLERMSRKIIFRGIKWSKPSQREQIIQTILILCQVQPNRELMTKLTGKV